MTNREMFERNQRLSTEFNLHLLDPPDIADQITDGALVVFVPAFDKELARRNRALARHPVVLTVNGRAEHVVQLIHKRVRLMYRG
jgi:hypothetical protein